MCNPGAVALGAQSFGVGMSTAGAFFGASMQKDALKSQARIDEINARIADGNARAAIERGTFEESSVKLRGTTIKNRQKARYAASGVDIAGSDSALAVMTGTDVITEVDAAHVRANALRAAWGERFKAGDYRRHATSARASAKGISPGLAAATSLIEGAGQVASSWYSLNKEGAFSSKVGGSGFDTSLDATRRGISITGQAQRSSILTSWDWGG